MSDNILRLIPDSPTYMPGDAALAKASIILREDFHLGENARIEIGASPRFVDPGSNLEKVICPNCNLDVPMDLWQNAMDKAYENGFKDLMVEVPCCGLKLSLNHLLYDWPAGFAQFLIEIKNPTTDISDHQKKQLETILGTPLRKIWAHY